MGGSPSSCRAHVSKPQDILRVVKSAREREEKADSLGDSEECIDLQYLRATENNPVGLYNCAGLGNTGAADKGINWPLVNATTTP